MNKKGKCYSMVNVGQRKESDLYCTPCSMTEQFIEKSEEYSIFDYKSSVLEPSCGKNHITKVLKKHFNTVTARDININSSENFLDCKDLFDYIITNPPYSLVDEFVLKSKIIAKKAFAFLLRINYLQGKKRYDSIFNNKDNYRLKYIFSYTRMSDLSVEPREDGKYSTGMQPYAWFIWVKGFNQFPVIDWIDNQKYVLKKMDKNEN